MNVAAGGGRGGAAAAGRLSKVAGRSGFARVKGKP